MILTDRRPIVTDARAMATDSAYTRAEQAVLRAFGDRVRDARERRGWTQERLAEESGLDRT